MAYGLLVERTICIHTHTYIHMYVHTYILYIYTYLHIYIRTYRHAYIHTVRSVTTNSCHSQPLLLEYVRTYELFLFTAGEVPTLAYYKHAAS